MYGEVGGDQMRVGILGQGEGLEMTPDGIWCGS